MILRAWIDLTIVAIVFWGVYALKFLGVSMIGIWTMLIAGGLAVVIIIVRKEQWRDYGFRKPQSFGWTMGRAGEFAFLTFIAGVGVTALLTLAGHAPTQSTVLTDQPDTLIPFLIDVVIGGWLAAGIGEEFFFRGFLLTKFRHAFGGGRIALILAVLAQGIWFGAGHLSQGLSGVLAISLLGVVLGAFYVTRSQKILIPMMIGHAAVDTLALTINYLN
jgi:CAAX protease family protein